MKNFTGYKIVISHNLVFLFSFFYYLLLPLFVGFSGVLMDYPRYDAWYKDFRSVESFSYYYLFCILFFVSFYLGSLFSSALKGLKIISLTRTEYRPGVYSSTLMLLVFIFVLVSYLDKLNFSGYKNLYDHHLLGAYATFLMLCAFLMIHFLIYGYRTYSAMSLFIVLFFVVILLGAGSRMYVLISMLAIFLYCINAGYIKLRVKSLFLLSIFSALLIFVGVWRVGLSYDLGNFFYILASEPSFTFWSSITFIGNNNWYSFLPFDFISSFINIVPRPLFPSKNEFLVPLSSYVEFSSPLGAQSIFVSLVGNFGILFFCFFVFLFSVFISVCSYLSYRNDFFKWYYAFLSSVLAFSFFRDSFSIVNKLVLFNGLFLPLAVLFFLAIFRFKRYA